MMLEELYSEIAKRNAINIAKMNGTERNANRTKSDVSQKLSWPNLYPFPHHSNITVALIPPGEWIQSSGN